MLTDTAIRKAKAKERLFKLSDGHSLQLWCYPNGAKLWRYQFRINGKQQLLSIGRYPETGLADARKARDEASALLKAGRNPAEEKKLAKATAATSAANTFIAIAEELEAKKIAEGRAENTIVKYRWLIGHASKVLGHRPVHEITPPEILGALRKVEERGHYETAGRVRATIGEVFRYAIATGRAESDPSRDLRGALISPAVRHRAAIVQPEAFGGLLRAIATYDGTLETRLAFDLLALTFVRPGELRAAEWPEFDLAGALWTIPAARMKMRRPHKVPLAPQALALLAKLRPLTGAGKYLFPSVRSSARCMSENTLNAGLRRLGFSKDEMTAHGFRAAASSILNESGLWNPDAIEAQLAHTDENSIRRAYQRAEFWDERVKMMTFWAGKLDELRRGKAADNC